MLCRRHLPACGNGGKARSRSLGPRLRAAVAALSLQLRYTALTAARYFKSSGGQLRAAAAAAAWRVCCGSAARLRSFALCGLVHCTQDVRGSTRQVEVRCRAFQGRHRAAEKEDP